MTISIAFIKWLFAFRFGSHAKHYPRAERQYMDGKYVALGIDLDLE